MQFLKEHQLNAMLFMSGICFVLAVLTILTKSLPPRRRRILAFLEIASMILLLSDRFAYMYRGDPDGLKGEEIPELARIIGVADAYDAMTSKRSYRDPMPQERAREEIVKGSGKQFDPQFAEIMLHQIDLDTDYTMKES